jgi:hypothetical protein
MTREVEDSPVPDWIKKRQLEKAAAARQANETTSRLCIL